MSRAPGALGANAAAPGRHGPAALAARAALAALALLALAGCWPSSQDLAPQIGAACSVGADPPPDQTAVRGDAPECPTHLCLRPAIDVAVTSPVDTGATCTNTCRSDEDCANAAAPGSRLCRTGYTCGVATDVGSWCCVKVCLCRDFVVVPDGGLPVPVTCDASNPVNTCANLRKP